MTNDLKQIVRCEELGMLAPFESVCFEHALSKACQYTTFNQKVGSSLQLVSIKSSQFSIQAI
jgi:hypothetical protein